MKPAGSVAVALAVMARTALALAEAPDLSGTWKLDETRSRVAAEAGLAGLIGAGAPERLHITRPRNGTLVVESEINESHARLYVPGGESSTPVFLGQAGRITMRSRWEGATLVSEGIREAASGASATVTEVKEVFELGADGITLGIEVTTRTGEAESASTLTYTRVHDVGPCESWATPCKSTSR